MTPMFAVVRHPDVAAPGTVSASGLDHLKARGWYRVSEWREMPADFELDEYLANAPDLDAQPAPQPVKPAKTARKESSE